MTLFAFIITSVKYHLKLFSAKFLLPVISLKLTLCNYLLYSSKLSVTTYSIVPFSMALEEVELMHECFSKHGWEQQDDPEEGKQKRVKI